ncbi:MAG TPA: hypothetical protein VFE51_01545 [Verrucomicrobiae bacterium]|nr:hypothetical protein [Verrucomicrobiae bacterium]
MAFGLLMPNTIFATDSIWVNSGTITFPPQIDASNFVNSGTIDINSSLPFETSSTRNYTNSGTMICTPGWIFDNAAPNTGIRKPANSFVNLNEGLIQSLDAGLFGFGGVNASSASYLWVSASNLVNKGTLSVGGNGWLRLVGTNVNVARSALEVTTLQPIGSVIIGQTNFLNDVGINDVSWGQTNGLTLNSATVYNGNTATTPPHQVQIGPGGPFVLESFSINQPFAFGYSNATDLAPLSLTNSDGSVTNILVPTNIIKQAVFVSVSDPSVLSAAVTFFPSTSIANPFRTVCVQLALEATNVITGTLDQTSLYFFDTLASETNRGLMVDLGGTALPPFLDERPANYDLSRIDDGRFAAGTPGNVNPDGQFLFDPGNFTNPIVTAEYAGYSARVNNLASEPLASTPGTVTNFPGRIQILADNLDFRSARVRGEGEVVVQANHLLSSSGAAVDCENLSYTLGSTNGSLNVSGLTKPSVLRLKGDLLAWSGLWSNQMTLIFTNNFVVTNIVDTNGVIIGTNAVPSPLTNTASIGLCALILDGDGLAARVPVVTWDLVTHSTNIVISDSLSVVQTFLLDGQSFTLDGNLALTSTALQTASGGSATTALNNWVYTNAPDLLFFTNNGTLTVPSEAHFGDDRAFPYSDFINIGTLRAGSINIRSGLIENDASISATVGPLNFHGGLGIFQNDQTASGGDIDFFFDVLKFNNAQLAAMGALNFAITNALSDAGPTSSNSFQIKNGFNLFLKPDIGDLLGTTFQDAPPNFVEVDHVWAGADRGASADGYSDNAAIGQLVLQAQSTNPSQAPLFFFAGAGGKNGLYVDLLDLTGLGSNYLNLIEIDPSLTIYYAAARLGFVTPPSSNGIPQEPEEFLDGQFEGHLRWVSAFAGPNSSVDVVTNGTTVSINRALRFSKIIDSNGNGLPNFYDPFPFDSNASPLVLTASVAQTNQPVSGSLAVSWNAVPAKTYQLEFATDLERPLWQPLDRYTNSATINTRVTLWDTNAPAGTHRFYRLKMTP